MSLIGRITGADVTDTVGKIPVHQFFAALVALADGQLTRAQVDAAFDLTELDKAELTWLTGRYAAAPDKDGFLMRVEAVFMLAEHSRFRAAFPSSKIQSWLVAASS